MIRSPSSKISSSADGRTGVRFSRAGIGLLATMAVFTSPTGAGSPRSKDLLFERPYPIVAYASFPGGLFHWIDSLAGTSAGKTIPAYREEYTRRFGRLGGEDERQLRAFVAARTEHREWVRDGARREGRPALSSAMLGVFCGSATVEQAMATMKPQLSEEAFAALTSALAWFRPKYERIWADGVVPEAFLERVRSDPGMPKLARILDRMVRFYDVAPTAAKPPRIALVPVPDGYGTHAEAIEDVLLLEIRPGESLADQASVIAHENAHFLWSLVPQERQRRLAAYMGELDESAGRAWILFREAIPTALGQGVTDRSFRPGAWSMDDEWYHTRDVDQCAKRIYSTVRFALDSGTTLDEAFLLRAVEALRWDRGFIPRAP